MERSEFYRDAVKNLGILSTVRRAINNRFGSGDLRLTSQYLDHPVHARRSTTDLTVFDQIFVEREYQCLDNVRNVKTIVDLGANCGYSSAYLLSVFADSRVVSVEPDVDNFAMLSRNVAPYGDRALVLNGAVWSDCRTIVFEEETMAQGIEWGRRTREDDSQTDGRIQAWDVPTIMQKAGFTHIDILKIDVEGAEEQIFSASDLSWLAQVRNLVIELHGPACEKTFHAAIKGQGFALSRMGELTVCKR